MNLNELLKALSPELKEIELSNGVVLHIHRPKLSDFDKCTTAKQTLIFCVSDSEGNQLFSDGHEENKVNIDDIDSLLVNEIYTEVLNLWSTQSPQDDVEKK